MPINSSLSIVKLLFLLRFDDPGRFEPLLSDAGGSLSLSSLSLGRVLARSLGFLLRRLDKIKFAFNSQDLVGLCSSIPHEIPSVQGG